MLPKFGQVGMEPARGAGKEKRKDKKAAMEAKRDKRKDKREEMIDKRKGMKGKPGPGTTPFSTGKAGPGTKATY